LPVVLSNVNITPRAARSAEAVARAGGGRPGPGLAVPGAQKPPGYNPAVMIVRSDLA
jgi:hypothetical protein